MGRMLLYSFSTFNYKFILRCLKPNSSGINKLIEISRIFVKIDLKLTKLNDVLDNFYWHFFIRNYFGFSFKNQNK
jgi:hypothetical protein